MCVCVCVCVCVFTQVKDDNDNIIDAQLTQEAFRDLISVMS